METTINRVDIGFVIVEQCSVKWRWCNKIIQSIRQIEYQKKKKENKTSVISCVLSSHQICIKLNLQKQTVGKMQNHI